MEHLQASRLQVLRWLRSGPFNRPRQDNGHPKMPAARASSQGALICHSAPGEPPTALNAHMLYGVCLCPEGHRLKP